MQEFPADLVDEIFTKTSADIPDAATVTLAAADTMRRPFVSYAKLITTAGTMECRIGSMIVQNDGDINHTGFYVGNYGDAVTVVSTGGAGTKRYSVTCGYLRNIAGGQECGVQDS